MPSNKVYNIMDIIAQELAAKHIIDDKKNVIDQNAFMAFITTKERIFQAKLAGIEQDGVIAAHNRNKANYYSSVLETLRSMRRANGLCIINLGIPEREQYLETPTIEQKIKQTLYKTKTKIQSWFQRIK